MGVWPVRVNAKLGAQDEKTQIARSDPESSRGARNFWRDLVSASARKVGRLSGGLGFLLGAFLVS